jgi:putative ABC transport system ATP-binding protein
LPTDDLSARCHDLVRIYRSATSEVRALRGVSAEFPRGVVTAVTGPSGSGKSSLLRLLAGIDRPTSGTVEVEGVRVHSAPGRALRRLRHGTVGVVFQRPSDNFLPYLTVWEHLGLAGRGPAVPRVDPDQVLEGLGISHRARHLPGQLSGGEQQRAAFAQVLMTGAQVVLADEPTAELDEASARGIVEAIRGLTASGVTVVVATHDRAVARAADHRVDLEDGRVRSADRPRPSAVPAEAGVVLSPREMWGPPGRPGRSSGQPARSPVEVWRPPDREMEPLPPSGPPVVRVDSIRKTYHRSGEDVHAVEDASLTLHPGEVVGLIGRSGSGKTTLLNVIGGWERADSGRIRWEGRDGETSPPWAELAVLPQRLGLIDELTIRRNVEYPARLAGSLDERRDLVEELLEMLGLGPLQERYPKEVSVGEQQRTALARALVLTPRVILADEPTSHQDHAWARSAFRAIRRATEAGTCCVVATHDDAIAPYLDRLLVMRDGRVEAPAR